MNRQTIMTVIQHNSAKFQRWGQSVSSVLRLACCWHVVLAALMVTSPAGFARCQEVESIEAEVPVEECVDPPEFDLTGRPVPLRRSFLRMTRSTAAKGEDACRPQLSIALLSPGDSISGHRLSNGLRAPLLC